MKEIMRLGLILLLISAVAAALLGYTNEITKAPIEAQVLQANIQARQSVLGNASEFEEMPKEEYADHTNILEIYKGIKDGQLVGYTIKTIPNGYAGPIEVMIGITLDGVVSGVSVGNHTETPGLGAKATDDSFKGQYRGKAVDEEISVIKAGTPKDNEVVAIAGATITSDAVTDGVNAAIQLFNEKLK